jgi:hypothetical protein
METQFAGHSGRPLRAAEGASPILPLREFRLYPAVFPNEVFQQRPRDETVMTVPMGGPSPWQQNRGSDGASLRLFQPLVIID